MPISYRRPVMAAAAAMLRRLLGSRVVRSGVMIILGEIAILAVLGSYYLHNLEREIDRRAAARIEAPGRLMQEGLLRLASVGDRDIMRRLVGDDLALAMVVGGDLNIFFATDPPLVGRKATEIPGVDPAWFARVEATGEPISAMLKGSQALVTIAPLRLLGSTAPFLYSYVAIDASQLAEEKAAGWRTVLLASLLCIAVTAFIAFTLLAKREAEIASRSKTAFLAMMSHELRTPINAIVGILDLLRLDLVNEKPRELIELCHLSAANLMRLIDDILDFARAEAGALTLMPSEISIGDMVEEVASLLGARAGERNLDLLTFVDPLLPALVKADPMRVRQIFFNLIGNAIKFTPAGHVAIAARLEAIEAETCTVLVEVSDSGEGITEEQQTRLFQPFVQLDPTATRRAGGVGLGLSICRHLVTLMDGEIGVRSKLGEGTIFWVRLTLPVVAPPPPRDPRLAGVAILVAERNALASRFAATYLREEGAIVREADGTEAALALLREHAEAKAPFGVAVIAGGLRSASGPTLADALAADPARGSTALLRIDRPAVASEGAAEGAHDANAAGSGRLTRPFRRAELGAAVLALLADPGLLTASPPQAALPLRIGASSRRLATAPGETDGPRILVVDDNPVNRIVFRNFLEHMGLNADVAVDGVTAWAAFQRTRYDLVLTDCHMPEMDGFELARRIRGAEAPGTTPLPILALTADTLGETEELCRRAGMNDRLCKPIRLGELQRLVRSWLGPSGPAAAVADEAAPTESGAEPSETASTEPPVVLDPAPLDAACGDDPRERAELVRLFLSSSERLLANLGAALFEGLLDEAEEAAHAVGGIAHTIGAYEFGNLCMVAERHLREGDRIAAEVAERQLAPALGRVRAKIAILQGHS